MSRMGTIRILGLMWMWTWVACPGGEKEAEAPAAAAPVPILDAADQAKVRVDVAEDKMQERANEAAGVGED